MATTFVPRPTWLWLRIGVFALPVVLSAAGGATLAKPTFLVAATLMALVLVQRRPAVYVAFALWLFVLTPGLRHFVDWYAGYSQANPMMLAPYCVLVISFPTGVLYLLNQRRYAALSAAMLATIAVGAWMTLLTGLIQEPLLTALRWVCPIFLGLYIWAHAEHLAEIRAAVIRVMRIALPLISAYGLVQFVSIMPWDAYYMRMAPITSIGWPEPYMVRVFSTMNHSGSFAAFLATGILLLMPRLRGLEFVSILLACCALFTTTQRSAMGALMLALLVLMLASRSRTIRAGIRKLAFATAIAVAVALAVPGMAAKLVSSVGSVAHLSEDGSAQERLVQYAEFPTRIEEHPFGSGLAWYANRLQNRSGMDATLDSGIIDILVSFGIVGGTLYLTLLGVQLALGWRIALWAPEPMAKAEFGVVLYGLSQLPFGVQHAGEHGFFLYLGIGLLLARACVPAESRGLRMLNASQERTRLPKISPPTQWGGLGGETGT